MPAKMAATQSEEPPRGGSRLRPPVPRARRHTGVRTGASIASRATSIATWLAFGLVVLGFVAIVAGPMTGRYRVSVILSDSMKPRWETGDVVISTPERPADVRAGQVITFNPPIDGRPSITHRVVRLVSGGPTPVVVTKGDANATSDAWGAIKITRGPVMRVRGVVPNLGWALKLLTSRTLATLTTVICPILLLLVLLWRIWRPSLGVPGVSA